MDRTVVTRNAGKYAVKVHSQIIINIMLCGILLSLLDSTTCRINIKYVHVPELGTALPQPTKLHSKYCRSDVARNALNSGC